VRFHIRVHEGKAPRDRPVKMLPDTLTRVTEESSMAPPARERRGGERMRREVIALESRRAETLIRAFGGNDSVVREHLEHQHAHALRRSDGQSAKKRRDQPRSAWLLSNALSSNERLCACRARIGREGEAREQRGWVPAGRCLYARHHFRLRQSLTLLLSRPSGA